MERKGEIYRWQTAGEGTWEKLKAETRRMRSNPTPAEDLLWRHSRMRILGFRFRRQHVIERFIVDFCSLEGKLIIEVDGPIHKGQVERDAERDAILQSAGFQVLRFSNDEVMNSPETILDTITRALKR